MGSDPNFTITGDYPMKFKEMGSDPNFMDPISSAHFFW